jgi:outer membrane protein W
MNVLAKHVFAAIPCCFIMVLAAPSNIAFSQSQGIVLSQERDSLQEAVHEESPIDKGGTILSGLASFASEKAGDDTRTTIAFVPNAIFFVASGFGIGFDISFTSVSVEDASQSVLALGPKIMVAFGSSQSTVYPYLGIGVDYLTVSADEKGFPSSSESGSIIKAGLGMMFKVNEHVGIPLELGILITNTEHS